MLAEWIHAACALAARAPKRNCPPRMAAYMDAGSGDPQSPRRFDADGAHRAN